MVVEKGDLVTIEFGRGGLDIESAGIAFVMMVQPPFEIGERKLELTSGEGVDIALA